MKPEELYEELLTTITTGDYVLAARNVLCRGAPMEPVGGLSTHALSLAVSSNRPEIVSLLMSAGASLTSTSGGLLLLKQAWKFPDVPMKIKYMITRVSSLPPLPLLDLVLP